MGRIVIDRDACKGCYLCVEACPKNLLKRSELPNLHGDFPVESDDENNACVGCAACAINCPDAAIREVYR